MTTGARRGKTTRQVWRLEFLTPWGRMAPFPSDDNLHVPRRDVVLAAHCPKDTTHAPPAPDCTCGVYGVDRVGSLLNMVKAAEFNQSYQYLHAANEERREYASVLRLMVAHGGLERAVSYQDEDGDGGLVAVWSDGAKTKRSARPGANIVAMGVDGDPPGTWRGSRYTATEVVIQAQVTDDVPRLAELLPIAHHVIVQRETDDLLSSSSSPSMATPCQGQRRDRWTSDDRDGRSWAARACRICPLGCRRQGDIRRLGGRRPHATTRKTTTTKEDS